MMRMNKVGDTDIHLSCVGLGTCQMRLILESQAMDTLRRGFDLGVNWVHTAPDYGGAENIIARAVRESGKEIKVLSNASGEMPHFKHIFENTCRLLDRESLDMFGISGIDYCEALGQNVWGNGGMVEYLQEKKEQGRLKGIFCTTHGAPDYAAKLITSGCFDAVMLAYNPLGFHVLSYFGASEGKEYEDLLENRETIFPLAIRHNVSLLIMKPLAGGLLCQSKAFEAKKRFSHEKTPLQARDILKYILNLPGVCAVVPGTASVEEAEENALVGHHPERISQETQKKIEQSVTEMRINLCDRCGECEASCSKALPISWLFREAYIWNYPSDTFEALQRLHYFDLLSGEDLPCESCDQKTCFCSKGLNIPDCLGVVHKQMLELNRNNLIHATPAQMEKTRVNGIKTILRNIPEDGTGQCLLWLENAGESIWWKESTALRVYLGREKVDQIPLRHDVGPEQSAHFVFKNPGRQPRLTLCFLDSKGVVSEETEI